MCRVKGRRCECDTSEARKLRRYNRKALDQFSEQVIPPESLKVTPIPSSIIPRTIEEIRNTINASRRYNTMAKIVSNPLSSPAARFDDSLKLAGAGVEYVAEKTYGAPSDDEILETWNKIKAETLKCTSTAGETKDKSSDKPKIVLSPKEKDSLRELFERRNEAYRKTLIDVGVKFSKAENIKFLPESNEKAVDSLKNVMRYFPQSWIDASNEAHDNGLPIHVAVDNERGRYEHYASDLHGNLLPFSELLLMEYDEGFMDDGSGMSVVAMHEFSHRIECTVPGITRIEGFFLDRRAGNYPTDGSVTPEKLTKIYEPDSIFDDPELGYKDNFADHYMGRVYEDDIREILSSGMETLFCGTNGGFSGIMGTKADPDYKYFILGILGFTSKP